MASEWDDDAGWGDDDDVDAGWGDDDEKGDWEDADVQDMEVDAITVEAPPLQRQQSYTVLDESKLVVQQENVINEISDLFDVAPEQASCLLRHYQWKSAKLRADWFADQQKVRKKVGLTSPPKNVLPADATVQCSSAFCDVVPVSQAMALNCGHWFCNDCWTAFLMSEIGAGRKCVFSTCMGMACTKDHNHKFGCACNEMIPESVFGKYVKDDAKMAKYRRWVLDSFVEGQQSIKWCPKSGCGRAVRYQVGGSKAVDCQCGHSFCFSCQGDAHVPAPCDLVRKWKEKESSDDATTIWLNARTKQCPKCSVRIEKNKACNHMKCAKCGHDFCWLCKGPWSKHGSGTGGYYVCNKYNENMKKGVMSDEEKGILDNTKLLQKYTYYYNRFIDSKKGIGFTRKLWDKIERDLKNEDYGRYAFLQDAVSKLVAARSVLMWTYSMAYYLKAGPQKNLFEYQQGMLVENTEKLQDVMDNNDPSALIDLRKKIIDQIGAIDKFQREMVAQVENGDFEAVLLSHADSSTGKEWACVFCGKEQKGDAVSCSGCSACRKHGEPECKACKSGPH